VIARKEKWGAEISLIEECVEEGGSVRKTRKKKDLTSPRQANYPSKAAIKALME